MINMQVTGTKNELKWFERNIRRAPKMIVAEFSNLEKKKGSDRYYKAFVKIARRNIKADRKELQNGGNTKI